MKRLIQAVQKVFLALLGASVIVAVLGIPAGRDADLTRVEAELSQFSLGFKQADLERTLLDMAQVQGKTTLKQITGLLDASGLPEQIGLSDPAAAIAPLAALELSTLGAVHRHSKPDSSLDIAAAAPEPIAVALSWRLARLGRDVKVELTSITLQHGKASRADVERETLTHAAREHKLKTARAHAAAARKHTAADDLYRARIKWKAHWKMIKRANEKRQEAAAEAAGLQRALAEASDAYQAHADAALAFKRSEATADGPAVDGAGGYGVAAVELRIDGKPTTIELPVALSVRTVPVSPLSASSFTAAHETGLWPELEGLTAEAGLAEVRGRFSWHHGTTGQLLLHGLPVLLPLLLLLLLLRTRAVSNGYSPFNADGRGGLPRVGLGRPALDAALAGLVPAIACGLCGFSLMQLGRAPAIPALCAVLSLVLGGLSFGQLRELRALTDAVVRSHSAPPPPGVLERARRR